MCNCKEQSCCSSSCKCGCQLSKDECCSSGSCCDTKACCGEDKHKGCCDHAKKLLCLADQAWMEVLKEKMKQHIMQNDTKIDEIARVVSEANHERWQQKMAKHENCAKYEDKLKSLFGDCSSGHCSSHKDSGSGYMPK